MDIHVVLVYNNKTCGLVVTFSDSFVFSSQFLSSRDTFTFVSFFPCIFSHFMVGDMAASNGTVANGNNLLEV